MVCDCCKKKKRWFESFAAVKYENVQLNFCVDCNDLAYKVRDAADEHDIEEFSKCLAQWNQRAKKASDSFKEWQKSFVSSLETKMKAVNDDVNE